MKKNIDLGLLIFRLTLGILMFMHGFYKVINGVAVMVVAFLMAHIEPLFALGKSGAWLHEGIALFLFGGLGVIFTGGGKYAVSSKHKWD